jgi:hypothetical protein
VKLLHVGGTIIENSAKLLSSRDPLMQRAGADRLRVLAVNSQSCRNHILSSSTAIETIVARIEACSKPGIPRMDDRHMPQMFKFYLSFSC